MLIRVDTGDEAAKIALGRTHRGVGDPLTLVMVDDTWIPELQAEETANDSDKKVAVTADEDWVIRSIWVEFTSTGTAGNRQLVVEIQDDTNDVIFQVRAGATQAASLTYYYAFAPNLPDLTALRDTDYLSTPFPADYVLPEGYQIRIYDNNAVDAAADDMVLQILIGKRENTG